MNFLKNKFVIVDLETSGLDENRDYITEVGAIKIEDGVICDRFATLVNTPQMTELPREIEVLTGITFNELQSAPSICNVLKKLSEFSKGCKFVAHNAPFDIAFLRKWGGLCGVDFYSVTLGAVDTVKLAQNVLGDTVKNYRLATLAKFFGIEFTYHRALSDAETTAKIFLRLANM